MWRRIAAAVVATLALAACGSSADDSAGSTAGTAEETAAAADTSEAQASSPATASSSEPMTAASDAATSGAGTLAVASSDLGDILVDDEGRTLYFFDNDTGSTSTCYDDCASNWPAVTEEYEAGEGVDAGLLGTSERDDGTAQLTYNDRPLYYFAGDGGPGETNGQGVGDVWWVVAPDGTAITDETARAGGY